MKPILDDESIAEARRLYETTDLPVARLLAAFGLTQAGLDELIEREGWTRRAPPAKRRRLPPDDAPAPAAEPGAGRGELVQRAWALAEAQMGQLERYLARLGSDPKATPHAGATRSIAVLIRALRELEALDPRDGRRRRRPKDEHETDAFPRDLDQLRDELAKHLEGLRRGRSGAGPADEAAS
jgi:hypothetical protein